MLSFNRSPNDALLDADIPDLTSASVERYDGELKQNRSVGQQAVTLDGRIYSRTYRDVIFDEAAPLSIDRVNLSRVDPLYEADHYYRVIRPYQEEVYTSSIAGAYTGANEPDEDFRCWSVRVHDYRCEQHYRPKKVGELVWVRPTEWSIEVESVDEEGQTVTDIVGTVLPTTFVLPVISVGKEYVACKVESEPPVNLKVELLETPEQVAGSVVSGTFFLLQPYLRITLLEITVTAPLRVCIEWWGEHVLTRSLPVIQNQAPPAESIEHPVGSSLSTRLKPPNKEHLPDDFWNSTPNNAPALEGYWERPGNSAFLPPPEEDDE
jgi:hypothetical protein